MICIYKITSPTNKINIGQTWDWVKRQSVYKRIACPGQRKLYNSLKKYGFEAHKIEILITFHETISQESLDFYETYWWKHYKDLGFNMLNIKEPGSHGKLTQETKNKLSKSLKGRIIKQSSIEKMINTRILTGANIQSKEAKEKIGKAHKGKTIPLEMRERIANKLRGRKLSPETIEKARTARIGIRCREETKRKISEATIGRKGRTGEDNNMSKKVININTNEIFCSIKDAAEKNGYSRDKLKNRLKGIVKNNTNLRFL